MDMPATPCPAASQPDGTQGLLGCCWGGSHREGMHARQCQPTRLGCRSRAVLSLFGCGQGDRGCPMARGWAGWMCPWGHRHPMGPGFTQVLWRTGAVLVPAGSNSDHPSLSCGVPQAQGWLSPPLSTGAPGATVPPERGPGAKPCAGAAPGIPVTAGSPAHRAPWHQALQAGCPRPGHQLHCPSQPCAGLWPPPTCALPPTPRTPTPTPPEGETSVPGFSSPALHPGVPLA